MKVVVKIGTSSLTKVDGSIKREAIAKLCDELAEVRKDYSHIILVSSGAIGVGLPILGYTSGRPEDSRIPVSYTHLTLPTILLV